ncbi:uncharacterized protein JN550_001663 [Neoarthrinium moseri]|uniref:uncharacterized protein n=1 Tax=Neoarthrinium moseri TaxID=1658444 RepID=UPI001FDB474A|nr:uncharacterized protein JN550_001663 [Neoarthrinium moseri]KAI1876167.1 hypothetical protein JN550_001663 [Neoarthrinium moseri]
MPKLHEISYSRDRTIAAANDYYEFLMGMYLSESEVLQSPASGWPSINAEDFGPLGKTPEVLDLLRHLPYSVTNMTMRSPKQRQVHASWTTRQTSS